MRGLRQRSLESLAFGSASRRPIDSHDHANIEETSTVEIYYGNASSKPYAGKIIACLPEGSNAQEQAMQTS